MMKEETLMRRLFLTLLALGLCGVGIVAQDGSRVAAADGARFTLHPASSDPALSASSTSFALDALPGQTIERAVRVQNVGDTAGAVHLFAVDATTGATSGVVYRNETDPRSDVGTWIAIDGIPATLNPGESKDIPVTITVPAAPRSGQHSGGIVAADTLVKTANTGGTANVNIKTQTIMPVTVNLPGQTVEKIAVSGVTSGGQSGRQILLLGLRNDGTTLVAPTGTLVVTNAKGQETQNLPLKLDKIVPNTAIQYPVAIPTTALSAGDYQANVVLTYGQSGETHDRVAFTITPAQIELVFPSGKPAPAAASPLTPTLAAPASRSGNAVPVGSPVAMPFLPSGSWLLILEIGGGIVLLLGLVGGAFAFGQRRR